MSNKLSGTNPSEIWTINQTSFCSREDISKCRLKTPLRWRHNGCDRVSNHQPHHCLINRLFRRRSKKTLKLRVTGLCVGNSPETGEFPAQMASYTENVSIWWRHHAKSRAFCSDLNVLIINMWFVSGTRGGLSIPEFRGPCKYSTISNISIYVSLCVNVKIHVNRLTHLALMLHICVDELG